MLRDPDIIKSDVNDILSIISNGRQDERISTGMYKTYHWNFNYCISNKIEEYPKLDKYSVVDECTTSNLLPDWLSPYGVCDSPEQWREVYAEIVNDPNRYFCVALTEIVKADQPEDGGWRWHKWGEYIGKQDPQCEYIYDEPNIERVFTFHVYELLS